MSKKLRNRNRPTHHEDVQGLAFNPALLNRTVARTPVAVKPAATTTAPKPSAFATLASAVIPSAVKSTAAAASAALNPAAGISPSAAGAAASAAALASASKPGAISMMPGKVATSSLPPAAQQALSSSLSSAASKSSTSASKLLTAAAKLKNHPALKTGMTSVANKHAAAAKSAATSLVKAATQKINGDTAMNRHRLRHAQIVGDVWAINQVFDPVAAQAAITQMIAQGSQDDASATLLSEMTDLEAYIAQLSSIGNTALANSGTTIDNSGNDLGMAWLNGGGNDPSFPGKVATWDASYQSWLNSGAYTALNQAMASGVLSPGAGAPNATPTGAPAPGATTGMPTLTKAMGTTDTVMSVSTVNGIMPGGIVQVDSEQMLVGNVLSANQVMVQRAYNPMMAQVDPNTGVPYAQEGMSTGTMYQAPPASHAVGAAVTIMPPSPYGSSTGAFNPGYGGGGGGGYGDDSGGGGGGSDGFDDGGDDSGDGSESALQAFRQQGVDPFDDSSDGSSDGGDGGDGSSSDGMSQLDADKASLEDDGSDGMSSMSDSDAGALLSSMASAQDDGDDLSASGAAPGGTYSDADHALLESGALDSDEALAGDVNWGSDWGQLFYNPAGILMDAMHSPHQSTLQATHGAQSGFNRSGAGASAGAQQNMLAAQQRLAAIKAQLNAQYGSQYGAPLSPPAAPSPYGGSGAYNLPYAPSPLVPTATPDPSLLTPDPSTEDVMGFPTDEDDDIIVDSYQTQITDADPEWSRTPAAPHAGASYLDPTYPRGGSVAGRQGGLIQPEEKIIVGHKSHYARGLDILGAGVTNTKFSTMMQARNPGQKPGVTQRAGFVQKTTPKGNKFTSLVLNKPKRQDHTTSIKNARTAGTRAISVGQKVQAQLKKSAAAIKKVAVHGLSAPVANRVAHHVLTAAQLAKAAQTAIDLGNKAKKGADTHQKALTTFNAKLQSGAQAARQKLKLGSGGKAVQIKGDFTDADRVLLRQIASTSQGGVLKAAPSSPPDPNNPGFLMDGRSDPSYGLGKHLTGRFAARNQSLIRGCDLDEADVLLGAALDALTEDMIGTCIPDPSDPGWCLDGTVDPSYGGSSMPGYGSPYGTPSPYGMPTGYSTAPPDPNNPGYLMDGTPDPNYGTGTATAGPPDYGLGPAPTADSVAPQPGVDYVPDPFPGAQGDLVPYSSQPLDPSFVFSAQALPIGAVMYDGSQAPPYMGLGSYTTFYQDMGGAPPAGGEGSGYQWHNDGWWSFRKGDYSGPAGSGDQRLKHADTDSPTASQQRANNSMSYNWGPMIGSPTAGWTKGLRYDVGGNQWFWYYDQAPAWAQQPIKQMLLNQAILDYQANLAAAAADYAAQQAADQLNAQQMQQMQQQQALEDAQQQHQLSQEQAQAQSDASVQQLADAAQATEQQTQDASYAAQTQAEAAAQAQLDQSSMLTQASIDQKAAETAARIDAMAQQAADQQDAQVPDGTAYQPDDGSQYDDGSTPYDGYADAKDQLDSDDETQSADDVMGDWEEGEGEDDAWAKGEGEMLFGLAARQHRRDNR